jgi:aryl-alcohol dehydrogenase-like predicted oxidoreductase
VEFRPLGATGLRVTPIGLGLAALGRPAYITLGHDRDLGPDKSEAALRARSHEVLDAAYAVGIRYIDAARSYGHAEAFLGAWLTDRGRAVADVTVGSKWGYRYVGGWRMDAPVHEVKDHSLAMLERQLAESRSLLGDRLRLYQVHSATFESGVLADRGVLGELVRQRDAGLVIGLTTSGPNQADVVRAALAVELDGRNPFACVQATWNLLEPAVGPALGEAHAAGWGVIVKEVVANGRLAGVADAPSGLRRVAARHSAPPDAVAIAATLDNPWADVVLSGAVTVGQLESNVAALGIVLDAQDRAELADLAEPAVAYWAERSRLDWA